MFASCILSFNKLRNIYKVLDDMKYALISGASSGLAKEVINLIEDDYFIFAVIENSPRIRRVGPNRTGHWEIADKKENQVGFF